MNNTDKKEIESKTITQMFLSLFGGKWFHYGHWSMALLIGSHSALTMISLFEMNEFLSMIVGQITGWVAMLILELAQHVKKGDTGFNMKDIMWNTIAFGTGAIFITVLYLITLWINVEIHG